MSCSSNTASWSSSPLCEIMSAMTTSCSSNTASWPPLYCVSSWAPWLHHANQTLPMASSPLSSFCILSDLFSDVHWAPERLVQVSRFRLNAQLPLTPQLLFAVLPDSHRKGRLLWPGLKTALDCGYKTKTLEVSLTTCRHTATKYQNHPKCLYLQH